MADPSNLKPSDFCVEDPDWIPSLRATVRFRGVDVSLTIGGTQQVRPEHASHLSELLDGWHAHLQDITRQTEDYLQAFLPGRKISPSELVLWSVTFYTDDGIPSSGCFFYRVSGEYDSPKYELDQFDHHSVVELCCPVDDGTVNWAERGISATNDFD